MTVIIGIDPGSRRTGYGVIRLEGNRHIYLASGHLNVSTIAMGERLRKIYAGVQSIVKQYQPTEAAIEQIFMKENVSAALKLGQARGAAMVALEIPISEYSARAVKKSIVGNGAATKEQVQFMIKRLLNLNAIPQADAADALAIALCHAHARQLNSLFKEMK